MKEPILFPENGARLADQGALARRRSKGGAIAAC
jgi:hypothetical protein